MFSYRTSDTQFHIEPVPVPEWLARLDLSVQARSYAQDSRAANTRKGYLSDTKQFARWCAGRRLCAIPATPAIVANYVSWMAGQGRRVATIERSLAAISQAHKLGGYPSPRNDKQVREVMKGIRRTLGVARNRKAPVMLYDLQRMVAALPKGLKGLRDRALLVLGFSCAFRRSELTSLNVEDLAFTVEGLEITLRSSKTDQEHVGVKIGVPYGGHLSTCPIRSAQAWLTAAGVVEGPVFRPVDRHGRMATGRLNPKAVASVVKTYATLAGLHPDKYAGHSLRSGFITTAARAGKPEHLIMRQSRHQSVAVFRTYVRESDLFSQNAAAGIGL